MMDNISIKNLSEMYFGVGGHYKLDYTSGQIAMARSAFEDFLYPYECLSILGNLRGILECLVEMFNEDDEPTKEQNDAWEDLAVWYAPEDLVPHAIQ